MKKRAASLLICIVFLSAVLLYSDYVNAKWDFSSGKPEPEIKSDNQYLLAEDQMISGWSGWRYSSGKVKTGDYSNPGNVLQIPSIKEIYDGINGEGAADVHSNFFNTMSDRNASGMDWLKAVWGVAKQSGASPSWSQIFKNHPFAPIFEIRDTLIGESGPFEFIESFFNRDNKKPFEEDFSSAETDKINEQTKPPKDVNVYKPNIYVYTDNEIQLSVQFEYPELLTKTIPEYGSGWLVTTEGASLTESCLTDSEGRQYDYLFYESVSSKTLFQTKEGYLILADQREEEFRTILSDMGFNEQEINDFCEFWTDKLEDSVDYVMYPQNTDIVNNAMPVTIDPQPEKMERIWFLFEEDYGQPFEEPNPYVLNRDGKYTVIEWGGLY